MTAHAAAIEEPVLNKTQIKVLSRARKLAAREDYDFVKVYGVLEPEGDDLWEVLFTGRYRGSTKAKIPGDPAKFEGPYRAWVRADESGFITEGW